MYARFNRGLVAAVCLCGAASAVAQTPSATPEWHYSEGHLLDVYMHDSVPKWDRVVGLATSTSAKYEGGDAYSTSYGPTFDIRYRDEAFASAGEGFGVNLLHMKNARAGIALTYDLGREQQSDHFRSGVGSYQIAPEAKVFAEYLLFPVTFRVSAHRSFGGQGGWVGDVSAYMPLGGKEGKYFIFAGPSVEFADHDNMRHVFGIDAQQSQQAARNTNDYPIYHAASGIRDYSFGVSGGYFFTRPWIVEGFAGGEQLVGTAARSPLVHEQGVGVLQLVTAYRW
jgi:outer membrane scaffolding protein for murein synthesis (MipA/OmpV family)